jgi:hypothetical protein
MKHEIDPIQSALESLKSRTWTGEPFNPQLEEKLMQEFNRINSPGRTPLRVAAIVALSIVLIGGGAFAATGGIAKLKSWVFRVSINGQDATLIAEEGQPASMVIQGEDGKTTTIHVLKAASPEGGDKTHVTVNATSPDSQSQQVVEMVRREGGAPFDKQAGYTLDDIGDAEPTQTWTDDAGLTHSLYIVPSADGEWMLVFRVTADEAGTTTVAKLAQVPALEGFEGVTPEVTLGEDGMTTFVFDNGQGEKRVIKTRIATGEAARMADPNSIQIKTEDGRIQVDVQAEPAGDEGR